MQAPAIAVNRGNVRIWIVGSVALLLVGILVAGFDLWSQSYFYASTGDAQVTGKFVQIGAPSAAQVAELLVQTGDYVSAGQKVATVQLAGLASSGGWTTLHLRAPRSGRVVSLPLREGQLATVGQPVVVLADPDKLWVVANLDETSIRGVQPGQLAEIHVGALDRTLYGTVAEVVPEFKPDLSSSGARARASSSVPVRVEFDSAADLEGLYPGMSAYVKIRIR